MHVEVFYKQSGKDDLTNVFHTHHGVLELICIRAGRGKIFVGERVLSFAGDTLLLIDGAALHHICPEPDVPYLRHKLILDKRLLCDLALPLGREGLLYRIPTHEQMQEIDRSFARLHRQFESGKQPLFLCAEIFQLLHLYVEQGEEQPEAYHGMMADVMRYIHENLAQGTTLADVAAALHVNKFYLCRLFRRETGMTMGAYINSARIATAKHLLRSTEESISFIAAECGFNELSVFTRNFKKEVGMTPTDYKAQLREK